MYMLGERECFQDAISLIHVYIESIHLPENLNIEMETPFASFCFALNILGQLVLQVAVLDELWP